ncbi:nucleotidyl transferase AbiEii/AbiGii toxin family protein [Actinomadura logoneensis]|uniref:Nucleotidyl transferase AbiEii/AbiGii toxin family protein n=1 Tax=Actinomadura logoneensis TaxID=2293572 RepID=A0A372JKP8_9ACTN|nr:nucleotidyl transferase AbiEii/AbiGii toxin family protein [Actinomadura logoneensis]RFU40510.1 nucleotidyl transferase AbiEii/AbiGii toxin family protein [Actinomadura logoneensis]
MTANPHDPSPAARRRALDAFLAGVAGSPWAAHLVLRGSALLRAWFGAAAREPGDLDFVVVPDTLDLYHHRGEELLDGVMEAAERASRADTAPGPRVAFRSEWADFEDRWDYDGENPGRRFEVPYDVDGGGSGVLQVDFAFRERLPVAPEPTEIPRADGGDPATVLAVTPALSLAWKLLWLVNETPPQGKDLFDAVLLAERVYLPADLLVRTFELADTTNPRPVTEASLRAALHRAEETWSAFREEELPDGPATSAPFAARLLAALHPTFDAPREPR